MQTTKTIVFITGAFVSHHCWDEWIAFFSSKGYRCLAPPWPYKDAPAEELRQRQPNDTGLASLRLQGLFDHYIRIVAEQPEKPIVIGHSLGGLLVQMLVNRDVVDSGVAIHSAPPQGVITLKWSFLKSLWKPMGFFSSADKTHLMSFEEWQYAFTNGMSPEDQKATYEKYCIPESRRVLRDCLTSAAHIDFKKPHVPLLFVSGTADHIMPASLNYDNYLKYKKDYSVADYKEFEGKNHSVLGLPSWHDEADYIYEWLKIVD